ncbi:MAG: WD40 repeat domain-containing protein, partial [Candidatus Hydrothermarchaeales archaeon]
MKWTFPAFVFIVLVFFTASGFAASQGYFFQWQNETGGWVRAASITADGGRVAAGSGDTYAYLFDSDGEEIWRAKTSSYINSVSLSSDGSYLAAASDDTRVYLFDRNGAVKWAYDIGSKGVSLVSLAGDGSYLAAASDHPDNRVYFFNRNGTLLWRYKLGDAVTALTISENGSHIAAGSLDTNIYTFDRDGRILWTYDTGSVGVSGLAISGDGRWVAAGTQYNNLTLINDKGVLNWSVATAGRVKQVFFTKGDSEIAAFTDTDVLEFFSMEGAALFNRSVDNRIKTLALSADGSKIAAGFDKPNIGVYYYA